MSSFTTKQSGASGFSEALNDADSIYSANETESQPRSHELNGEDVNCFLEFEAALANAIYQCVQLIRQKYTSPDARSLEEIEEFERLLATKADLLDLYHLSEELVYSAAFRSPTLLYSAKALHAEEDALLRDFHAMHHLVWEGHFMKDEEILELEDMLEQNLPWMTTLQQRGRRHEATAEVECDNGKGCRQPDDYLPTTLKIMRLRVYLKSKTDDLRAGGVNFLQTKSAQKKPNNNQPILEELQRSHDFWIEKHALLKLEPECIEGEVCEEDFCMRQRQALVEQTRRLQPLMETAAKNAEEIHKLREAVLAMRKDRDSVIARNSALLPSPPGETNVPTNLGGGDVARVLSNYYSSALPSWDESSRLSEYTTMRQAIELEKKEQSKQLAEIEAQRVNFEAQKLILEARERRVSNKEERLRGVSVSTAAPFVDTNEGSSESPPKPASKLAPKLPETPTDKKGPSKFDVLKKQFESKAQPDTPNSQGNLKDRKAVELAKEQLDTTGSQGTPRDPKLAELAQAQLDTPTSQGALKDLKLAEVAQGQLDLPYSQRTLKDPKLAELTKISAGHRRKSSIPRPISNRHSRILAATTAGNGNIKVVPEEPNQGTPPVPSVNEIVGLAARLRPVVKAQNSANGYFELAKASSQAPGVTPLYPTEDKHHSTPGSTSQGTPNALFPTLRKTGLAEGQKPSFSIIKDKNPANGIPDREPAHGAPRTLLPYPVDNRDIDTPGTPSSSRSGVSHLSMLMVKTPELGSPSQSMLHRSRTGMRRDYRSARSLYPAQNGYLTIPRYSNQDVPEVSSLTPTTTSADGMLQKRAEGEDMKNLKAESSAAPIQPPNGAILRNIRNSASSIPRLPYPVYPDDINLDVTKMLDRAEYHDFMRMMSSSFKVSDLPPLILKPEEEQTKEAERGFWKKMGGKWKWHRKNEKGSK